MTPPVVLRERVRTGHHVFVQKAGSRRNRTSVRSHAGRRVRAEIFGDLVRTPSRRYAPSTRLKTHVARRTDDSIGGGAFAALATRSQAHKVSALLGAVGVGSSKIARRAGHTSGLLSPTTATAISSLRSTTWRPSSTQCEPTALGWWRDASTASRVPVCRRAIDSDSPCCSLVIWR